MSTLYNTNKTSDYVDSESTKLADYFYSRLSEVFWETDVFTRYGALSSIGIFPF